MSLFNLPRLQDGNTNMPPPARPGEWQRIDDLGVLSNALDTGEQTFGLDQVKSVPTLWGRVAIFEDALTDPNHLAHDDAVSKWRALITLLALRGDNSFRGGDKLQPEPIDLSEGGGKVVFHDLADKQRPQRTMDGPDGWSTIHLLGTRSGGRFRLIGTLSPTTLVAPARSPDTTDLSHPWLVRADNTPDLRDPLSDPTWLSPDQMKVVLHYLHHLGRAVKPRSVNNPTAIAIEREIARYTNELRDAEGGAAIAQVNSAPDAAFIRDLREGSILRDLNLSMITKAPDELVSDCRINTKLSIGGRPITVLLADPKLGEQGMYDRSADRISLVNQGMLGGTKPIPQIREETHTTHPDVLVLAPDDIFSPFLTPLEGAQIPAHPPGLQDYLLPFLPAVFLLMDAETLSRQVDVRGMGTDRLTVTLELEIQGRDGENRVYKLARDYHLSEDGVERDTRDRVLSGTSGADSYKASAPAALAAWPDFQAPFWKHNYLFAVSQPGYSPVVTSGLSREMLLADLATSNMSTDIYRRLGEWARPEGPWGGTEPAKLPDWYKLLVIEDTATGSENRKTLQKSDYPFTAAACAVRADAAGYTSSRKIFAGIGLLEATERVSGNEVPAKVAVDFGTTNTTVYIRWDGRSEAVEFAPRLRRCSTFEGKDADFNYRGFMPADHVKQPFTTVAQVRNFRVDGGMKEATRGQEREILFKDYAFFDDDLTDMIHMIEDPDYGGGLLRFGLKWSQEAEDRAMVARYIGHLALLSLAELGAKGVTPDKVTWLFSYPMSIRQGGQEYRNLITNVALQAFDVRPGNVLFITESDAALEYFASVQAIQSTSRLLLDIGGGTTDIGIVVSNKPVWRHSLQIAGADLVANFIGHNRDFLREIGLDRRFPEIPGASYVAFADDRGNAYSRRPDNPVLKTINALVNTRHYSEGFQSNYPTRSGEANFERLKSGAFLMLGGLLYYLGLQTRALQAQGGIIPDRDGLFNSVEVCFAGRGCSLLQDLKTYETYTFDRVLEMFYKGLDLQGRVSAGTFADHVKHETAAGMMAIDDVRLARLSRAGGSETEKVARVLGAGVDLYAGGEEVALTELDLLSRISPDAGTEVREIDMGAYYEFLNMLGETTGLYVNIDAASDGLGQHALIALNTAIDVQANQTGGSSDMHTVNPPFISMLRETLNLLYRGEHVSARWEG